MNSPIDPEKAELQRKLDECKAEKRSLRAKLRRTLSAILGGVIRKDEFADSEPEKPSGAAK